jgi:hypothetical protein
MKPGQGKNKGNAYERHIAKLFRMWSEYNWIRTPQSGGMREVTKSDLFCKDLMGTTKDVLFIETKKRKRIDLHKLLQGKGEFFDWWKKTEINAQAEDKYPVLVFVQNNRKDLIALDLFFYKRIELFLKEVLNIREQVPLFIHVMSLGGIIIVPLEDFFSVFSYNRIVEALKEHKGVVNDSIPEISSG